MSLQRVAVDDVDWEELDGFADRMLFQRRPWLDFLQTCHGAEPVIAQVLVGNEVGGWFTGLISRHLGVRVLGAPRSGWTTPYLGFNLLDGVERREVVAALRPFAFHELGCAHLEVCDRWCLPEDLRGLGGRRTDARTFVVDLRPAMCEVSARMTSGTRQNLRKAVRSGLVVEDAKPEGFADEYYAQLRDVFAKQGLVPTYPSSRVQALIDHLYPTGDLQLIRVRTEDGTSIATALVLGNGRSAYFWGGASWRSHQRLRPNEALFWHAFCTWKDRGAEEFDFGGGGTYKLKYGASELVVPQVRWSRWPAVEGLRAVAQVGWATKQRAAGALLRRRRTG